MSVPLFKNCLVTSLTSGHETSTRHPAPFQTGMQFNLIAPAPVYNVHCVQYMYILSSTSLTVQLIMYSSVHTCTVTMHSRCQNTVYTTLKYYKRTFCVLFAY